MKTLLIVILLTVFSLAAGACAYSICRRIKPNRNALSVVLLLCLPVIGGAGLWAIPFLFFIGLISNLGAWGYRKSLPGETVDKKSSYRLALTATLLALPLGIAIPIAALFVLMILLIVPTYLTGGYLIPALLAGLVEGIDLLPFVCCYFFSLLLTPSLMPFLLRGKTAPDAELDIDWHATG
jgi:hypothetical protein